KRIKLPTFPRLVLGIDRFVWQIKKKNHIDGSRVKLYPINILSDLTTYFLIINRKLKK
ncbi:hypothetical protein TSAR_001232, partial [Trichomalopsis sarcophagae]